MDEGTAWLANGAIYISGKSAWGLTRRGYTFSLGLAENVRQALRDRKAEPTLAKRLETAGVRVASEETSINPSTDSVKRIEKAKEAGGTPALALRAV